MKIFLINLLGCIALPFILAFLIFAYILYTFGIVLGFAFSFVEYGYYKGKDYQRNFTEN